MNEESKQDIKSLAQNLNLKMREVVQRALPEYFELERDHASVFRRVEDSQRLNYALDYVFLDEREKQLHEEEIRLKKKYTELKKAIAQELAEIKEEKERLRSGIRYSVIRDTIESPASQEKASAPTNLISPSKDLEQD